MMGTSWWRHKDTKIQYGHDQHNALLVMYQNEVATAVVMSHDQWADFLLDVLNKGPAGVMHKVRLGLYQDDGK